MSSGEEECKRKLIGLCEKAIDEELWRVGGIVRKEQRKKLCERVETILQKLFEIVEEMERMCDEINSDKLLSVAGRGCCCIDARISVDEAIPNTILILVILANGIPECEEKAVKWKERWERRGGKFKRFPL
ncbi:MAG: hypothetical protein EJNHJLOP_00002 [Methanophagales virus PBV082]|uniref:Uncharacterized protein n=1 Tax=Methanophagales virus PBV082 TaxID=3071307 RepID=A0AA46TDN0_9VIRU|nr:MAG: hypothetical protein QIT52_gp02 [Methanophagales virus PBV082]UYL64891.1 MAG: hypothetical protein EJNHJLOP_00002 [Methanophagales virus PBV082]